jgi:hypothetical protein
MRSHVSLALAESTNLLLIPGRGLRRAPAATGNGAKKPRLEDRYK